jgi:hypothetical protein
MTKVKGKKKNRRIRRGVGGERREVEEGGGKREDSSRNVGSYTSRHSITFQKN